MIKKIIGKNLRLRDVEVSDASFILSLRLDEKKGKYLHKVSGDLRVQKEYILSYKSKNNEWYFIIESLDNEKLGTIRIYDIKDSSFCWGSWIIKQGAPIPTAIESALLIYEYAFYTLNFDRSHFDVRKENKKVQLFHERMLAKQIGETELDFLYSYSKQDYEKIKEKYKKWLVVN